jgi:hypothetical protein
LSFGLVAIPVKLYPAIKDQTVRFQQFAFTCCTRNAAAGCEIVFGARSAMRWSSATFWSGL